MEPFVYDGYIVRYSRMHSAWVLTDKYHHIYCFHDDWLDAEKCKKTRDGLAESNTVR